VDLCSNQRLTHNRDIAKTQPSFLSPPLTLLFSNVVSDIAASRHPLCLLSLLISLLCPLTLLSLFDCCNGIFNNQTPKRFWNSSLVKNKSFTKLLCDLNSTLLHAPFPIYYANPTVLWLSDTDTISSVPDTDTNQCLSKFAFSSMPDLCKTANSENDGCMPHTCIANLLTRVVHYYNFGLGIRNEMKFL